MIDAKTMSRANYKKARAEALKVAPASPPLPIQAKHVRDMTPEEHAAERRHLGLSPFPSGPTGFPYYRGTWRPKKSQ